MTNSRDLFFWIDTDTVKRNLIFIASDLYGLTTCLKEFARLRSNWTKKIALHLSVHVFSTKVLIGDTILTSPNGDGNAILRGLRATRRSRRLQCKGSTLISQLL